MKDKETFFRKAGVSWATVVGVMVIVFMFVTQMIPIPVLVQEDDKTWHVIWEGSLAEATEAALGEGASGFLEIFFVNHTATPATAYDTNVSSQIEGWCNTSLDADGAAGTTNHAYAIADAFRLQVKHSTLMDVVVRVRFNRTHAWNGTMFHPADCRVNITASGGGITILGTVSGTNVVTGNSTGYGALYLNVYWDNAAAGYQLSKGQECSISSISIQAKY